MIQVSNPNPETGLVLRNRSVKGKIRRNKKQKEKSHEIELTRAMYVSLKLRTETKPCINIAGIYDFYITPYVLPLKC